MQNVRIWDLPTRLFHWLLLPALVVLIVTAKTGGSAMAWHFRTAYLVLTLLLFRLIWGFVGGHRSRFVSFWPTPSRLLRYLRGQATPHELSGHNPLGGLSVLALLLALALQVLAGLFADDDIFFAGPLSSRVSGATVDWATHYHTTWGPPLIIGLVVLHVLAVAIHQWRGHALVGPMVWGDRRVPASDGLQPTRDDAPMRLRALVVLALSAALVYALVRWGEAPMLG